MPTKKRPQNESLPATLAKPTKRARSSTTVPQTEQTLMPQVDYDKLAVAILKHSNL